MKLEQKQMTENEKLLGDSKAIRLFYVAMERFLRYSTYSMCVGHAYGVSSPFILPENMTMEDACKVVSYLTDKIEKESNIIPCTERAVELVAMALEKYGFKSVDEIVFEHNHAVVKYDPFRKIRAALPVCQPHSGVVDLFTVSGDVRVFERSDLNSRYFDWYTPKVYKQEIENIYNNIGMKDILINAESEVSEMQ